MEEYLEGREGLRLVVQLVDIRHEPTAQDIQMYDYLRYYNLSGIVVATKADKVSRNEINRNIAVIRRALRLEPEETVIPVSALKKTGYDKLLAEMDKVMG